MHGSFPSPGRDCARRPAFVVPRPASAPASDATADALADLVHEALVLEVGLTPKPGLVGARNSGAHRDMDFATFLASAESIRPWIARFFRQGAALTDRPATAVLAAIRPTGLACERAMYVATGGVNTHRGSIFAFGLLAAAAGRLSVRGRRLDAAAVCDEVARIAGDLVAELATTATPRTAGERLYRAHGLTGARGEAASGFATVRLGSLPVLERRLAAGASRDTALAAAFLHLLEHNRDTNLVARGGLPGLVYARRAAARLRRTGGVDAPTFEARFRRLDDRFIARNLSPGGSADLLALTWVLHRLLRIAAAQS